MKKVIPIILLATSLVACTPKQTDKPEEAKPSEIAVEEELNDTEKDEENLDNYEAKDFIVKEVNDDGYVLEEIDNKDSLFMSDKASIGHDDLEIGDKIKIHWNGVIMESYPAQFGKIGKVEILDKE